MFGSFGVTRDVNSMNFIGHSRKRLGSFINKKKRSLDVSMDSSRPSKSRKITPSSSPKKKLSSVVGQGAGGLVVKKCEKIDVATDKTGFTTAVESFGKRANKPGSPLLKKLKPLNPVKGLRMEILNTGPVRRPTPSDPSEGMHPGHLICRLNTKNGELSKRIMRLEEQNVYWRRKSLTLETERNVLKGELSKARTQIERLDNERLKLQDKLITAESNGKVCAGEIERLVAENSDLSSVVEELNKELENLMDVSPPAVAASSGQDVPMGELSSNDDMLKVTEQALADTLADLSEKLEEIETLKTALASMSQRKTDLEKAVTRHTLLAEMISMKENDDQKDPEGDESKQRIATLQAAVEKCMFRIALLTEKNEQLKVAIRHARGRTGLGPDPEAAPGLLNTLQDGQKVKVLESLCMQRYRKLLRETAETMIGQNTSMDESF